MCIHLLLGCDLLNFANLVGEGHFHGNHRSLHFGTRLNMSDEFTSIIIQLIFVNLV